MLKRLIIIGLCYLYSSNAVSQTATKLNIVGLRVEGAYKTDPKWLESYLGLHFPLQGASFDLRAVESKLLTTGVFSSAIASLEEDDKVPTQQTLKIELIEKWTIIPVVRASLGGGTPLKVIGIYDTHALGSLWTWGLEARQYGNLDPGGVIWARAPRWQEGHHVIGAELWQDIRERALYDESGKLTVSLRTKVNMLRLLYLHPLPVSDWQAGLDFRLSQHQVPSLTKSLANEATATTSLNLPTSPQRLVRPLLSVAFDAIEVANLDHQGIRFTLISGPLLYESASYPSVEVEAFAYQQLARDLELATHAFIGGNTSPELSAEYFLGGLESIRGLPDGMLHGNKASYANVELRKIFARFSHAWLQGAVFFDGGSAADEWGDLSRKSRITGGAGLRIAVPQVNRLMFRIDYAASLDRPRQHGINFGMNQLFQPHRPL